jgi:hypothetical protein
MCLMHSVVPAMSKYCSTMSGCLPKHPFPSTSSARVNLNDNPSIKPGFQFQLLPSEEGCEIFRNLKCNFDSTEAGIDGFTGISFLLRSVTRICYWEKTKDIPNETRLPPGTTPPGYRLSWMAFWWFIKVTLTNPWTLPWNWKRDFPSTFFSVLY